MDEESKRLPLWISGVQEIEDRDLRQKVVRAAERNWDRMVAHADRTLAGAATPAQILDDAVDATLAAHRKEGVRDFDSYLLAGFINRVAKIFRRERKVEYQSAEELAELQQTVDIGYVERLEAKLLVEELISLMDEQTRCIYAMKCQDLSWEEIGSVLGISADSARMSFKRGIERLRRRVFAGSKNK